MDVRNTRHCWAIISPLALFLLTLTQPEGVVFSFLFPFLHAFVVAAITVGGGSCILMDSSVDSYHKSNTKDLENRLTLPGIIKHE